MSDISRTRLRQWTGNILAVCLGFAAVGILLATAEAVLRFKVYLTTAPKDIPVAGKLDGALSHATILGVEGKPNSEIRCRAARDGRVLYDTICRTDWRTDDPHQSQMEPPRQPLVSRPRLPCTFRKFPGVKS